LIAGLFADFQQSFRGTAKIFTEGFPADGLLRLFTDRLQWKLLSLPLPILAVHELDPNFKGGRKFAVSFLKSQSFQSSDEEIPASLSVL
jgi:hypothetical protein